MTAIVAALLLTAGTVGLTAWLVHVETIADLLTPEPQRVVQSFVSALGAGRAESAAQHLATDARDATALARLRAAATAAERLRFEDADAQREGDHAEVRAQLSTPRRPVVERRFRLVRQPDSRLWKITHFDLGA